jgi:hypothetical protein
MQQVMIIMIMRARANIAIPTATRITILSYCSKAEKNSKTLTG